MCSLPVPREPLRRVAVTGGTHGNEMSGVYLARYWLQAPGELQRPSFSAVPVLANPAATAACRRYVGRDLNRTFTSTFLTARAHPDDPYEVTRARELNQLLGPKASDQAFDFILDLHNTTANVGTCLILESASNVFAMHLCRHLQLQSPEPPCRVFLYQMPREETFSIDSVAKNGMVLELGPQPQGVLRADLLTRARALVAAALDFIQLFNQGETQEGRARPGAKQPSSWVGGTSPERPTGPTPPGPEDGQAHERSPRPGTAFPAFEMEAYGTVSIVDFPRTDAGDLAGAVHPQLQDQDFQPLLPGAPIFQLFSGEDVLYEGVPTTYPAFINEAAYYEKGIAFFQTEKLTFSVPALPALAPAPTPAP